MKITKRQLRRIIRETFLYEGYSVPKFSNSASMEDWLEGLIDEDPDAEVENDVINPETGETVIPGGETPREQPWWEEPDGVDDTYEEKYYGSRTWEQDQEDAEKRWEAEERAAGEQEEKERAEQERIQDMVTQQAEEAGADWAADTLYDARNNPNMWQRDGHSSAENYVASFGQDAAGDIADSLLKYGEDDVVDWWRDLPDKERPYDNRPTKQTMRDIVADYFYDGVSKMLAKKAA